MQRINSPSERHVISVSRRSDIPAFHSDWFVKVLNEGSVAYKHPYSGAIKTVSLLPEHVIAFVFWSKNYAPIIPHLEQIISEYDTVFHYTITGLPSVIEKHIPPPEYAISAFKDMARMCSAAHMIWRYDPIIISDDLTPDYHRAQFKRLAQALEGYTYRCYVSYISLYAKNKRTLQALDGICHPFPDEHLSLIHDLAHIALSHGMTISACCSPELLAAGIPRARCIDKVMIAEITGTDVSFLKAAPTRSSCGCCQSIDIGSYGTCDGGCIYCYAR